MSILAAIAVVGTGGAMAKRAAAPADDAVGIWRNPKKSVYVRTEFCGDRLCGEIVCATPKAIAQAQAKGAGTLMGTKVFEDLERRDDGSWRGSVFVPDRRSRFQSTLTLLDTARLEIRGCALGGLICKEQIWQRVDAPACDVP
jgi:uncharacterized protein (DUF2147 family)